MGKPNNARYEKTSSQLPYALYSRANNYETCGPRRDITEIPQLIIVRYKRNATEDSIKIEEKKAKKHVGGISE
ncbi:unnamed protein product [Camellia sinensis]